MEMGTTKYIEVPLEHLEVSRANARRTPAALADAQGLRASIVAHGLLTPLLVQCLSSERYIVVDGARRLHALTDLAAADEHYQPGGRIPCTLDEGEHHAGELSVAGNLHIALHPADQVEAFQRMTDAGGTVAEVANRFGVTTRTVQRRLALAGLAPEVLAAWRDGVLAAEHCAAFASNPDHVAQRKALRDSKHPYSRRVLRGRSIRRNVQPDDTPTLGRDKLGRFVDGQGLRKSGRPRVARPVRR